MNFNRYPFHKIDHHNPDAVEGILKMSGKIQKTLTALGIKAAESCMHMVYTHQKRILFSKLTRTIVEIGAGTGANLRYYAPGAHIIAVEPNTAMHGYLQKSAHRFQLQLDVLDHKCEHIALPSNSVETVVGTLVLCSVDNPRQALSEVLRILKPGGRFIFVEHVAAAAGTPLARIQNIFSRLWPLIFDGCHLSRPTGVAINRAGFSQVAMKHFKLKSAWLPVAPHIFGIAIK